jgi:ABC-type branched-subunit amino acid transport system substrate-binding protein
MTEPGRDSLGVERNAAVTNLTVIGAVGGGSPCRRRGSVRTKLLGAVVAAALAGAMTAVVPAGASTPSKPKFSGDAIVIGVTYPCDAPTPPAICEIAPAAQAAAKTINSQGGVKTADGKTHQLTIVTCNNRNDRSKTADCARQFVDANVVFATGIVSFGEEIVPILADAGIAYFAPICGSACTAEGTSSNSYLTGFTLGIFQGLTKELTDAGFKRIKVVAQGPGVAIGGLTQPIAQAGSASLDVVEAPLQNPNWAQVVAQATEDADVIMIVMDEQNAKAFIDSYNQSGKDLPLTGIIGIVTNDLIAATGGTQSPLKGGIATGAFPPPQDKAWADYRKGMKKYAKNTQLEPAGQQTWLAIQLAAVILKDVNGPVTAESFVSAVDATTDIPTLGGKLPPGKSFQRPEGIYPRIFNNDYWGPLKINGKTIGNGKSASFRSAPSAS